MNATQITPKFDLSCEQFAALNQVLAQSVRARLCRTGSYFSVRPVKLANGRLAFPNVLVGGPEHHAVAVSDRAALNAKQEAAEIQAVLAGEVA